MRFVLAIGMLLCLAGVTKAQSVDHLVVFFVPFNVSVEGGVTAEYLSKGEEFSNRVILRDSAIIQDFIDATSLASLIPKRASEGFMPYVQIDIYSRREDGNSKLLKRTLLINRRYKIDFDGSHFHSSSVFRHWLEANIF